MDVAWTMTELAEGRRDELRKPGVPKPAAGNAGLTLQLAIECHSPGVRDHGGQTSRESSPACGSAKPVKRLVRPSVRHTPN